MSGQGQKLRRARLFGGLSDDDVEEIARLCAWRKYRKGRQILGQQDTTNELHVLTEGTVRAKRYSATGKEVTYRDLGEGSVFGEYSAIDAEPRSATILALTDCETAVLSPERFQELLVAYPAIAVTLIRDLVRQVRDLTERVFEFSTLAVNNRIHSELMRMALDAGVDGNTARIKAPPTHAEIANRISTHREAVSREFAYLEGQALIRRSRHMLEVLDVDRLRSMVRDL